MIGMVYKGIIIRKGGGGMQNAMHCTKEEYYKSS